MSEDATCQSEDGFKSRLNLLNCYITLNNLCIPGLKPTSKFIFNSRVIKKTMVQLSDASGVASIPDHNMTGNKLRNFKHPFIITHLAKSKKIIREEIELIIIF